jgi:hypothetical protein
LWALAFSNHHAFLAKVLGMDELPYSPVINLQPALGEFGDQAAQGEVSLGSLQHPDRRPKSPLVYGRSPWRALRCLSLAVAASKWPW